MQSKFIQVLPSFVLVFTLAITSGEALKCYECIAVGTGTDECNGDIVVKSGDKNLVECDLRSMEFFHSRLQDNSALTSISSVFAVDSPKTYRSQTKMPMSCVNIGMKVGPEKVILRTCQTAQTETVKPCAVIRDKIKKDFSNTVTVDHCEICEGDKCNGSGIKSTSYIVTVLPLFISLLGVFYRSA
ncbi:uncharacterized protein [Chelonus insularis]|uniref:uncharacterized protein n=1 Tax=Chelonus insularis TaxID=460826 RepID=UPI00158E4CD7|nr:uncharacterized protein LOC118064329 [Chelonus insularis]